MDIRKIDGTDPISTYKRHEQAHHNRQHSPEITETSKFGPAYEVTLSPQKLRATVVTEDMIRPYKSILDMAARLPSPPNGPLKDAIIDVVAERIIQKLKVGF